MLGCKRPGKAGGIGHARELQGCTLPFAGHKALGSVSDTVVYVPWNGELKWFREQIKLLMMAGLVSS